MSAERFASSKLGVLLGIADKSADPQQGLHPSVVATYRLRVVAVGALITVSILANLLIYMTLPGQGGMNIAGFLTVMSMGIVALAGVVLTPWKRLLVTKWALRALYAWSIYGILLIGVATYFDGGSESVMYLMYPVLIAFFALAYSQRVQFMLFLLTVAVYCGAIAIHGWDLSIANIYVRISTLAIMAFVASILSGWLITEMRDRARSSITAEQRAGLLDTVARAARRVSSLDAAHVLSGALTGALELGCSEAEIWFNEGDPPSLKLYQRLGPDAIEEGHEHMVQYLYVKARETGDFAQGDFAQVSESGPQRLVACLLHREGEIAGLLVVKMSETESRDLLVIECIELLAAQVSAGIDVARNVAERRGLEERLAHWAFHDALTNLPNRVLFADRLELAIARTVRDKSKIAVLFLDLDGFKKINDTLGHAAGDELLTGVAHRLHASLRPNDTLARYGGDEFVILVEGIDGPDEAILVADRILDALSRPLTVLGKELMVKTSIGIGITGGQQGTDSDVLRRADMAMYQAKAAGGSCYVLSPEGDARLIPAPVARDAEPNNSESSGAAE